MTRKKVGWNRGYTSTEVALAIVLAGVLLFFALPRHVEHSKEGEKVLRDMAVVSVRAGIARFEKGPERLDPLPPGTTCSQMQPCFTGVVPEGIFLSSWQKVDDTRYEFRRASAPDRFEYDPENRTFLLLDRPGGP